LELIIALLLLILGRITETAGSKSRRLPHCRVNAVLHHNCQLDADALCVFNDPSVAEDGIDLGPSHLLGVRTEQGEALLLLKGVCARRMPLQDLGDSRFGLRRLSPDLPIVLLRAFFDRGAADFNGCITEIH